MTMTSVAQGMVSPLVLGVRRLCAASPMMPGQIAISIAWRPGPLYHQRVAGPRRGLPSGAGGQAGISTAARAGSRRRHSRQPHRHPREPSTGVRPRWLNFDGQKPADGSDTLAIAQIRWWHRTSTHTYTRVSRYVRLVRFSFLILIGRFVTLDAWFQIRASHPCIMR